MLINFLAFILQTAEIEKPCEVTTRLDGITVWTCGGRVAMKADTNGNIREYWPDGSILVRSEDAPPVVLERR